MSNLNTKEPLQVKEVSRLPECNFCKEEANIQTADGGMEINLCGLDNHPEYEDIPMVSLVLVKAE
ncbi:MAG: hypothetical protein KBC11_00860 [Candidatus Pacebacteria bacterium]|nr:hypothetical protein [Candidatus Paceibacterota bacterium]